MIVRSFEGIDIVITCNLAVDGVLNGIQNVICGHCIPIVELHSVTKRKGVGLRILADRVIRCNRTCEGSIGLYLDQSFINVEIDALGIRRGCRKGIQVIDLGCQSVDKASSVLCFSGLSFGA